jgi:hypothetical protein
VLLGVGKHRDRDPYASAFPGNLEGALKPKRRAQSTEARRIAGRVGPGSGAPADVAPLVITLLAQADTLDVHVGAAETAQAAETEALGTERVEQRRWRDQYRKDHGLLTARYPSDKRRVESFFKKAPRKPKKKGPSGGGSGSGGSGSGG